MLDHDTIFRFLRKNAFFDDMSDECLKQLVQLAREQRYAVGESFMTSGGVADFFGVLYEGEADLGLQTEERFVVVDKLVRHRVMGWSSIVPPHEWSYDARTKCPVTFIGFDGATLRETCETDHTFGVQMMTCVAKTITQRLMATRMALLNIAS